MIQKAGTIKGIRNVLVIRDGVLLFDYGSERFNNQDFQLISGFISALDSFSSEVTKSALNSIELDNYIFSLFRHENIKKLIFIVISEKESKLMQVSCKLRKMANIFIKRYKRDLENFSGEISLFDDFKEVLSQNYLLDYNCGNPKNCMECQFTESSLNFDTPIPEDLKESINVVNSLTETYSRKLDGLKDLLVLDTQGNVFNKKRITELKLRDYENICSALFPIIRSLLVEDQNAIESGQFSLSDYQIFYALFPIKKGIIVCFVFSLFEDIANFLPILYPIINQLSHILHGYEKHIVLPEMKNSSLNAEDSMDTSGSINKTVYLLGDSRAGKTSLLNLLFFEQEFTNYIQTFGISMYEKTYEISRNSSINFRFIDFSGDKRFLKVRKAIYNQFKPDTSLFVFDCSDDSNLDGIVEWVEETQFFTKLNSFPILLVGNKTDLLVDEEETKLKVKRKVESLSYDVIFTSTRSYEGIEELFSYLTSRL